MAITGRLARKGYLYLSKDSGMLKGSEVEVYERAEKSEYHDSRHNVN